MITFDKTKNLSLNGCYVCFTGVFANGMSRKQVINLAKRKGALFHVKNDVCPSTNILIVGEKGSEKWAYGEYGTKILHALEYRRTTGYPLIISETDFLTLVEKLPDVCNIEEIPKKRPIKHSTKTKKKDDDCGFAFHDGIEPYDPTQQY